MTIKNGASWWQFPKLYGLKMACDLNMHDFFKKCFHLEGKVEKSTLDLDVPIRG